MVGLTFDLHDIGRLPAPGDNAAIATRRLEAGTRVAWGGASHTLEHTILEGHRFAIRPVAVGEPLLSWGLPFGHATRPIAPGEWLCNPKILAVLRERSIDFALPAEANFADLPLEAYALDEASFQPGVQVPPVGEGAGREFEGYARGEGRGVGTRNYVVLLGTTSRTSGYVRALEEELAGAATEWPNIDGIVAVAHTEGGGAGRPNNLDLLLRTLAGFMVHPNVGAVLAVDRGAEAVTNETLRRYMLDRGYPLTGVLHRFVTLRGDFAADLAAGAALVRGWLPRVGAAERTAQPLAALKLGLQCGGSDAFSGVSGNPLAAWVAQELIRHGGAANLAETDELIGAEEYVLQNVRDLDTARRFLATVERFKELVGRHGHTAEGNPSGGNNYRGLYNIALKSLGAATKRAPAVRLDRVIDYAEPMREPGYYFMDSPGNDLESIAGQVASGSNLLYFVTGNGSITNFPFVPTIKIVTTTARYRLLARDMDVNAGAYLDGVPMDELGRDLLDLTARVAGGERSAGERAGHAQVSIWRNWRQTDRREVARLQAAPRPEGRPLPLAPAPVPAGAPSPTFAALRTERGHATDRIGLILPTSLCSGQIARQIADRLNAGGLGHEGGPVSRFVALPHTEGCGVSGGSSEELYSRTMLGYLTHPLVGAGLLLEHGCEKTHNDYLRARLREAGADPERFGWASIQLDGGIAAVGERVEAWFAETLAQLGAPQAETVGLGALRLGLVAVGPVPPAAAASLAELTRGVVGAGGTVVIPEVATILQSPDYLDATLGGRSPGLPTLAYGEAARLPGLHVMETPTDHWVEALTGLGATGVEIVLVHTTGGPVQGHRMLPVIQVTADAVTAANAGADLDLVLEGEPALWPDQLLGVLRAVASREIVPKAVARRDTDFQFTRGLLGVSM